MAVPQEVHDKILSPFKEFKYSSKQDRKGSQTVEYSRLEMAETKMEAPRRAITTELWFRNRNLL